MKEIYIVLAFFLIAYHGIGIICYLFLNRLVNEAETAEVKKLAEVDIECACSCEHPCNEYCHQVRMKEEPKEPELWIGH